MWLFAADAVKTTNVLGREAFILPYSSEPVRKNVESSESLMVQLFE